MAPSNSPLGIPGVLTLAGEGTRMLPWSRGLRKEFLPLYDRGADGAPVLKPIAHFVVEAFMAAGVSDAVLVVQPRDLGFVREYFTVDPTFLGRHRRHPERLAETREFYAKLRRFRLEFAVQPHPVGHPGGFGDAVLRAEAYVRSRPFLLQASDGVILEEHRGSVHRAMARLRRDEDLDAVLLVRRVADPRRYGVVEGTPAGRYEGRRRLSVEGMEEKPARPRSSWAATALYAFSPRIFEALRRARRASGARAELELTAGIRELLRGRGTVGALVLEPSDLWRSVGSPEGYFRTLRASRSQAHRHRSAR